MSMNWLLAAYLNSLMNQNEIEDVDYEDLTDEYNEED